MQDLNPIREDLRPHERLKDVARHEEDCPVDNNVDTPNAVRGELTIQNVVRQLAISTIDRPEKLPSQLMNHGVRHSYGRSSGFPRNFQQV